MDLTVDILSSVHLMKYTFSSIFFPDSLVVLKDASNCNAGFFFLGGGGFNTMHVWQIIDYQ